MLISKIRGGEDMVEKGSEDVLERGSAIWANIEVRLRGVVACDVADASDWAAKRKKFYWKSLKTQKYTP